MGGGVLAQILDPAAQTDRRQHIRHPPPRRAMHHRQGRGDRQQAQPLGQPHQRGNARRIVAIVMRRDQQMGGRQAGQKPLDLRAPLGGALGGQIMAPGRARRMQQQLHPLGPLDQIVSGQLARALGRASAPQRQQPAQPPPGRPVPRQGGEHQPFLQHDPRGGQQPPPRLARLQMRPHHPRDRVHIRHRHGTQAQLGGARHQLLGVGGPGEEGEVGGGGKLGKSHQNLGTKMEHNRAAPQIRPVAFASPRPFWHRDAEPRRPQCWTKT